MAPATPPRPNLSGEEEGSEARDRPKRDQPEAPASDDEAGCKRPRLVLPDPTADEGATPRRHLPFLDPAADEGATPRRRLPFLDPAADEGALLPGVQTFPSGPGGEERGLRGRARSREEVGTNGEKEVSRGHAQGREEGALSPSLSILHLNAGEGADAVVHDNSSGRGGSGYGKGDKFEKGEEGLRPQAQEEISKNEEILEKFENGQEGSQPQAHEEISKNEEILEKLENGEEGLRPQVQEISKNEEILEKFENGQEGSQPQAHEEISKNEEILEKLENGEEGLRPQAQEEISKNEEILEKFENSEEGSRLHVQEVSMNEAVLDLEKKQIKEDLRDPLESLEFALLDEFEAMEERTRASPC